MQIILYSNFNKKKNSTLQPTSGNSTSHTVTGYLREPCDILNPMITLQNVTGASIIPAQCTYAYISDFDRYYWITDWTRQDALWIAQMSVDVLASHKTAIGNQTEYILRHDSTSDFNTYLSDTTYPCTNDVEFNSYVLNTIFTTDIQSGIYVVGIISGGQSAHSVGAITYYALTMAQFVALKERLFSDSNLETMQIIDSQGLDLSIIPQEIVKTIYNPYQYIVSCFWFPFTESSITNKDAVTSIPIGWWTYTLSGYRIRQQIIEIGTESYGFGIHPQANLRGEYLNYAPYSKRYIVGRFGTVTLDGIIFKRGDHCIVSYLIDLITGQCIAKIAKQTTESGLTVDRLIEERSFLLGVPIQLAQVSTDYLGTAMTVNHALGDMFNSTTQGFMSAGIPGAIVNGIESTISGIGNTVKASMPVVETGGNNGTFLSPRNETHVIEVFYRIVDEDIAHRGRPLCELRQINTLSGFVLCAEGDIDINCYDSERTQIKNYLTTGFFWESV